MRWLLVLVAACNGKSDDSAGPIGEADADTDSDTDTDTDWTAIEGTLDYDFVVNGNTLCDATVDFTGIPYTGLCPECDFLFEVEGVLAADAGNGGCPFLGPVSIYDNTSAFVPPILFGFAHEIPYGGVDYEDALMVGSAYLGGGPILQPVTGGPDGGYGAASLTGNLFEWSVSQTKGKPDFEYVLYPYYYATCLPDPFSLATSPYGAGNTAYGSLPCAHGYTDVFEFQGDVGTAAITVDTTTAEPALAPAMWVYGPTQCVERYAYGNFDCTVGEGRCPAMSIDAEPGRYVLVVQEWADCGGETGGYRLDLDADWDPELTQIRDDFDDAPAPATLDVVGTATLK